MAFASDGNGGWMVSGSNTYATAGSYSPVVTITATGDTRTAVATATADVSSLTISPENISGTQGLSFVGAVATFSDANSGTTAASYSAIIDWGDGNESQGIVTATTGGFTVSGADAFAVAGTLVYDVTLSEPGEILKGRESLTFLRARVLPVKDSRPL